MNFEYLKNHGLKDGIKKLYFESRVSSGFGLVWPTPWGSFEMNYVIPLRFGKNDGVRSGLQMGFSTFTFV